MSGSIPSPSRPGHLSGPERRSALAAPADADGFVSRWHRVRGQRLHIRRRPATDPGAVPCVLLHGLAVSHRYLMPTARRLHRRGVYVPDLLGFGLSDKPTTTLDVTRHAEILATWLDAAEIAPAAVLGNSFGCQVAVELAVRRPDLVAALILVGPTTDPRAASIAGQVRRLIRTLPAEDWRQAPILSADIRDAGVRRVVATLRYAVSDRIDTKLSRIRVPTLLVRGARDRIAPRAWLDRMAALVPDARMLVVEGAAHNAVTTAGPELAVAIDTFLSETSWRRQEVLGDEVRRMDPLFAAAGGLRDAYDGVDWAATALGPVSSWGPALRSAVDLALRTRFAVTLLWGPQHVLVYNEAFVQMIADKHPRALGSPARDVFAEIWDEIGPMLKQVSGGGGAIWVEDLRLDLRRHGFLEECYFTFSYSPVVGADGRIEGVIDIASETTPQILAHRRLDLLNRLNDHLAGVDHHRQVIERALPLLREDPSDLPDVDIRPSNGELAGGDVSIRDTPAGKVAAIRLSAVDGALGDLTLTTALSPRLVPDEPYLGFIRLVAATLTQALDRTRLREAEQRVNAIEREISETIQRSLLTPPPKTRDFEIAVRYQPAVELAQIGGDWYDSFLLDDGTLTVVVGDISGHDRHAAAAMAQVRNMLRGVTHTLRGPPSRILTAIDDAMFGLDIDTFATVVLAQIEREQIGREQIGREQQPGVPPRHILRWSNAGHPAPILLAPDGTAQILQRPSQLLLGTGMTNTRSDHTVSVAPGTHVIFYTDGLIERRGEPIDQSQNALVEALSGLHHLSAEQLCDVLLASRPWTAAIDDIVITVVHTGAAVD